jgi:TPR repeat protein
LECVTSIGLTTKTDAEINEWVDDYERRHTRYDLFDCNCQHFAVRILRWLTGIERDDALICWTLPPLLLLLSLPNRWRTEWARDWGEGGDRIKFEWTKLRAAAGGLEAKFDLVWHYENGKGVVQNSVEALRLLKEIADLNPRRSWIIYPIMSKLVKIIRKVWYKLGEYHEKSLGTTQNLPEALRWYKKAADEGHVEAWYKLGEFYEEGFGTIQNLREALCWYKKAAIKGHIKAMYKCGEIYEKDLGEIPPEGLNQLHPEGLNQLLMALRWFTMYHVRRGLALCWYKKAADLGDREAMGRLVWHHENNGNLPQDIVEAIPGYKEILGRNVG